MKKIVCVEWGGLGRLKETTANVLMEEILEKHIPDDTVKTMALLI